MQEALISNIANIAKTDPSNSPSLLKIIALTQPFTSSKKWLFIFISKSVRSSFFCLYLQYLLDDSIFIAVDIDCLGNIATFLNNKLDFLLGWGSIYFPIVWVYDTLDWLIIPVTSIVGASWNSMWLILSCLLSGAGRFYSVEIFLIESSVVINAMFPPFLLEVQIIIEYVFSIKHFSLWPLCFVVATLAKIKNTLGYISFPSPWNWPFTNWP